MHINFAVSPSRPTSSDCIFSPDLSFQQNSEFQMDISTGTRLVLLQEIFRASAKLIHPLFIQQIFVEG